MRSIWDKVAAKCEDADLTAAVARFGTVLQNATAGVATPDLVAKVNTFTRMLYVHTYKNRMYGDSWKDLDMGYRLNIPWAKSKFERFINIAWHNDIVGDPVRTAKAVETLHDLINYLFFIIRMIELETGCDYTVVRSQCIEADYPDLDLEDLIGKMERIQK